MKRHNLLRVLTISLGGLWLLDGILQVQPAMFTSAFATHVLAPSAQSQPSWIAALVAFGIRIASVNPFWFNSGAAAIQLFIGVALLFFMNRDRLLRFALWLSIAWSLVIWIFGEGFGAIATGSATFYTGAPGSALLYAILALFLLDAINEARDGREANATAVLEKLPAAAGVLFLVGAALNLAPMFWQPSIFGNLIAIAALAALGIFLILFPAHSRGGSIVAWIAIAFLVIVWCLGQDFGGLLTFPGGMATDPNSALVMVAWLVPGLKLWKSKNVDNVT